jgi:hypothetical protein
MYLACGTAEARILLDMLLRLQAWKIYTFGAPLPKHPEIVEEDKSDEKK